MVDKYGGFIMKFHWAKLQNNNDNQIYLYANTYINVTFFTKF